MQYILTSHPILALEKSIWQAVLGVILAAAALLVDGACNESGIDVKATLLLICTTMKKTCLD